jgi:hypothetical protein
MLAVWIMDETRAINGNMPPPDIYRAKAASAADDGDGGGLGNAYERQPEKRRHQTKDGDPQHDTAPINEPQGSDPLLQALDRMVAIEGLHPSEQPVLHPQQAVRAYESTTHRRRIAGSAAVGGAISKLEQHAALEEKQVAGLLDDSASPESSASADVDYLPHVEPEPGS